jgi:hypothetical protein
MAALERLSFFLRARASHQLPSAIRTNRVHLLDTVRTKGALETADVCYPDGQQSRLAFFTV